MMGVVIVQIVSTVRQMEVEIRGIVASVKNLFAVDVNPIWITLESVNTAWKHESISMSLIKKKQEVWRYAIGNKAV